MRKSKHIVALLAVGLFGAASGSAVAKDPVAKAGASSFKPSVEDWMAVNAAVENYTLGLERHDLAVFDKAFWPEATIIAEPEPGMSFSMPYRMAAEPPPGAPGGSTPPAGMVPPPGMTPPAGMLPPAGLPPMPGGGQMPNGKPPINAIGNGNPPWHLAINHHFEFQGPTRATHYGYFVSIYPDLKTKISVVGLPGHYEDVLEKRNGEWRILQRKTVIGGK